MQRKQVFEFWEGFATPQNIRQHCSIVCDVAIFLSFKLRQRGVKVDIDLIESSALLHDSLKQLDFIEKAQVSEEIKNHWRSIKSQFGKNKPDHISIHEWAAYNLFKNDFPQIASLLKCHGYDVIASSDAPKSWEEKILSYADKRVAHNKIVTLKERFIEGHARYKPSAQTINKVDPLFFELEKEIFSYLDFSPDEIEKKMYEIKAVIFDYDGVLANSLPILYDCHKKTCEKLNIKVPFNNLNQFGEFFAVSWSHGVSKIVSNNQDKYWEIYREEMFKSIPELKLFPKIEEMLKEIKKTKKLCIVSDSREKYVLESLENNKIKNNFTHIVAGKYSDKPDPTGILECINICNVPKTNTVYVGDMYVDTMAANNAGVRCIAVTYGYHEEKHLNGAFIIVNSVDELKEVIK